MRDFSVTAEPEPASAPAGPDAADSDALLSFVIQKHDARRLHYDFRLELDGVLQSWAVPKGPSFDPAVKRLAVATEPHPLDYGTFEGVIPEKQYGAGRVLVWDQGTWEPINDPRAGLAQGKLVFRLHGQKLAGSWELIRTSKPQGTKDQWLLFKKRDAWARPVADYDVVAALPDSVIAKPLGPLERREPREPADPGHAGDPPTAVATSVTTSGERSALRPAAPLEPDLTAARKSSLPASLAPQLATLVARPPRSSAWTVEPKLDGYRLLARVEGKDARLFTRNGLDWTDRMPRLAEAVASLGIRSAWLDGEIVVIGPDGLPAFGLLQEALAKGRTGGIGYFVFDLPYLNGQDLRDVPLWSRRLLLRRLMDARVDDSPVRRCESFDVPPEQMLAAAERLDLEGLMLKRIDAPYRSGRSESWLKLKRRGRQELVVIGYRLRAGNAREIGALLLGHHEGGRLRAAGHVGTGWDSATARALLERLAPLVRDRPACDPKTIEPGIMTRGRARDTHWIEPTVVAEIAFGGWTRDGHVRHAVFQGLRDDIAADTVVREQAREAPPNGSSAAGPPASVTEPGAAPVRAPAAGRRRPAGRAASTSPAPAPALTHPDRVIDSDSGLTKRDLYRYYESVADWILPHLVKRPVALVRAPDGVAGQTFFQKHPFARMPGVTVLDRSLWPAHEPMMAVENVQALLSAAQMNCIELHTWNSTVDAIDQPDRVVFDLDPGDGVGLAEVQEGALLVRAMLEELGLKAWVKTSGGKGLHVVVPIRPKLDHDEVKAFSRQVVEHLARVVPSRFVAKSGGGNRVGRIFVDYLRNGIGQTTVSAFSARSRRGLGVSMPIAWDDVPTLKTVSPWTIANAREHLSFQRQDPWADYWHMRQTLDGAIARLAEAGDGGKPAGPGPGRKRKGGTTDGSATRR